MKRTILGGMAIAALTTLTHIWESECGKEARPRV